MRRILAALSATAVLVPLTVTAAPGTATAATNTLTVTAIGRDGAKVKTRVSVVNLSTRVAYTLTSGTARTLPKGTYAAMATIHTATDRTLTLGGQTAKVSGASATTIDARKGKPVEIALSPAAVMTSYVSTEARICTPARFSAGVSADSSVGDLYVIPNGSEHFHFAFASYTAEFNAEATKDVGYLVAGARTGIPAGYSRTFTRSSLVPVTMTARSGTRVSAENHLWMHSAAGGCRGGMGTAALSWDKEHQLQTGWKTPHRFTAYLTPGKWTFQALGDGSLQNRTLALESGKSYGLTFSRAVYGPNRYLPRVIGRTLSFTTLGMFDNPDSTHAESSYDTTARSVVTLTRGGKTLKQQTRDNEGRSVFSHKLPAAGWYHLTVDARRYHPEMPLPAGLLSPRAVAKFKFYADPKKNQTLPVHLVRFAAAGLDVRNSAKAGSTTSIELKVQRPSQGAPLVKSTVRTVTAQASYDNGKTWKNVTVKKSGGKWFATVKNPKSGYVSLRAKVTDTKGNASQITVYRAYRIA